MRNAGDAIAWDVRAEEFNDGGHLTRLIEEYRTESFTQLIEMECERNTPFLVEWERQIRSRPGADPHPPDQHSGDQHVGQSGSQHRAGAARGRLGACAALAVLGRAHRGRAHRGLPLSLARRRGYGHREGASPRGLTTM